MRLECMDCGNQERFTAIASYVVKVDGEGLVGDILEGCGVDDYQCEDCRSRTIKEEENNG